MVSNVLNDTVRTTVNTHRVEHGFSGLCNPPCFALSVYDPILDIVRFMIYQKLMMCGQKKVAVVRMKPTEIIER